MAWAGKSAAKTPATLSPEDEQRNLAILAAENTKARLAQIKHAQSATGNTTDARRQSETAPEAQVSRFSLVAFGPSSKDAGPKGTTRNSVG